MEEARNHAARRTGELPHFPQSPTQRERESRVPRDHRHHTSRRELRATVDALRRQRSGLLAAIVGCVGLSALLLFSQQRVSSELEETRTRLGEERASFATRFDEAQSELMAARNALGTAHANIASLVEGRIPGLRELVLDQDLEIADSVVRNIRLTQLPGSAQSSYELKVVLENPSAVSVSPALRIVLFDGMGVEVGRVQIGPEVDGRPLRLRPGEIRSHFAAFEIEARRTASYFRIDPLND